MHANTIVDAVGESWFVAKAMDVVQVDGESGVSAVDSRARQGTQGSNESCKWLGV